MGTPKPSFKNTKRRKKRSFKEYLLQFFVIGLTIASSSYLLPHFLVTADDTSSPIPTSYDLNDFGDDLSTNGKFFSSWINT